MAYTETQQPTNPTTRVVTAEGRYGQLCSTREPYLQRAREAATLTIPGLMPPEGATGATTLYRPFQSVGADGVNNLAAKLLLALFPPGSSFFRLEVDEAVMNQMMDAAGANGKDVKGQIDYALSKIERAVVKKLEDKTARPTLFEAFKHLIVAGNGLLHILPNGGLKLHTLANYVVKRDTDGNPVEMIVREGLSRRTLPEAARQVVERKNSETGEEKDTTETIYIYTWITRKLNGSWRVHQEIVGEIIPGTEGFYPKEKSAWLPLRWTSVPGEDYGRGFAEEHIGDLSSCESLTQSIVEFAAVCAKILFLVNIGGITDKKTIQDAPSGAIVDGNKNDVSTLQVEKFADFQVTKSVVDEIQHRLEQAFLLNRSVQRQAERVTAEEIRFMAGELEQALGGTYSVLSQELQRPLVVRLMMQMQRANELPHLPEKLVTPQIITGLDGLGRSSDLMKLDILFQGIQQRYGPEALAEYVNVGADIKRRAAALAIDIEGLVRSEEEVQKARQQQMMAGMTAKLGGPAIKAMSDQAVAETQAPQGQPTQ